MKNKNFSNKSDKALLRKIEDDRAFYIRDATEQADMNAIIEIADIQYRMALTYSVCYDEFEMTFRSIMQSETHQLVHEGDYEYINEATIILTDYHQASDFLTGCKLFINDSSDYELSVENDKYIFYFNLDQVDEDVRDV